MSVTAQKWDNNAIVSKTIHQNCLLLPIVQLKSEKNEIIKTIQNSSTNTILVDS